VSEGDEKSKLSARCLAAAITAAAGPSALPSMKPSSLSSPASVAQAAQARTTNNQLRMGRAEYARSEDGSITISRRDPLDVLTVSRVAN